jgi:hypothetical protein
MITSIYLLVLVVPIQLNIGQVPLLAELYRQNSQIVQQLKEDGDRFIAKDQQRQQQQQKEISSIALNETQKQEQMDKLILTQMLQPFDTQAAVAAKQRNFERPVERNGYLRNAASVDIGVGTNVGKVEKNSSDPTNVQVVFRLGFGASGPTGALPIGFPDQGEMNPLNLNDYDGDRRRIVPNKAAHVFADVLKRQNMTRENLGLPIDDASKNETTQDLQLSWLWW